MPAQLLYHRENQIEPSRRFLQARRMDLPSALGQFEEAIQFRREKDALRVYDRISVDDFEHTRKLVGNPEICSLCRD